MHNERRYQRFSISYRIEHWVLTISFALLAVTGLIQRYVDVAFPRWLVGVLGGIETVRLLHHLAAIVMMLLTIYHVGELGYRFFVLKVRPSMLPGKADLVNAFQAVRYNLGLSKKRAMQGHFTFEEKAEYWAVVWGTVVMGITGFILWNPIAATRLLPGDVVPAAKLAHGLEAVLAVLAIFIWHMYHVHLRHFNKSIFTGALTEEEMEDEHPAALARIKAGKVDAPPPREEVIRRRRAYLPVFGVLAAVMLAGIWFFVGYEETAIATLPPAEEVAVFVPLTPTPLPTARPTNTPTPTSTPSAAQPTAEPAGEADVAWESGIGELMKAKCVACHGPSNTLGGLDLSSYQAARKGGVSGLAVVPGEAHTSLLFTRQASGNHPGQLNAEELALVQHWLELGAPEKLAAVPAGVDVSWQSDIAALMQTRCVMCHTTANALGGLDVSSYAAALKGGQNGAGIVAGDAQASVIAARQSQGGHPGQFTPEELELLLQWIAAGAPE